MGTILNDIYDLKDDLLQGEYRAFINCPNCSENTVFYKFNPELFNYEEWEAKINFENKNSSDRIKLRIPDAIIYSKKLFTHPTRVFNELNSSYWSAWSWEACTQNAVNNLKLKCYHCDYDLQYLKRKMYVSQNHEFPRDE